MIWNSAAAQTGNRFFLTEAPIEAPSPSARKQELQRRNANSYFVAWQQRTALVKQQVAAESAANDAKTARLRALRLAKEAADKEAGALDSPPKGSIKKRALRANT